MRSKLLKLRWLLPLVFLVLLGLAILLPPIVHNYEFPTTGDDTAHHLAVLDDVQFGHGFTDDFYHRYHGQTITGWMIDLTGANTDTFFLWFNFIGLFAIGLAIFIFASKLVNYYAGVFATLIAMFVFPGMMVYFQSGTVYNIINMYLLGLIGFGLLIYWVRTWKWYYGAGSLVMFLICGMVHSSTGFYILGTVGLFIVILAAYRVWRKQYGKAMWLGLFEAGVGITNFILPYFLLKDFADIVHGRSWFPPISAPTIAGFGSQLVLTSGLILMGLAAVFLVILYRRGHLHAPPMIGTTLLLLLCLVAVLGIGAFGGIGIDPNRFALDLSVSLGILTGCALGWVVKEDKTKQLVCLFTPIVLIGCVPLMMLWFGYNSSIRPADMEAVRYLNRLECSSYSVSSQIAPWVYERFLEKDYVAKDGDFVIYRTEPMTYQCRADSVQFRREKESVVATR